MSRYRAFGLFLTLTGLWGTAFMAIKAGLAHFPPVLFAALRYDIAGVVMLGYAALVTETPIPRTRRQWLSVATTAVLLIAAYHALLFVGQTDPVVTSAAAAVLVSLNPLLTTGFARAFLPHERLTLLGFLGMAVGLAGAVVLANPDPVALVRSGFVAKGLILLAAAAFALGTVLSRRIDADLPIETLEGWGMVLGALLMHLLSVALGESPAAIEWTPRAVTALLYLALGASALGFLIYFDLLDRLGAIEISLVSYVAPLWAALAGWLVLRETPTVETAVGFVLVFAGFLLIKRQAIREEVPRLRRGVAVLRSSE